MEVALKKQLEVTDKFFASGDLRSAKMHADMAKARFPASPDVQRAHAAYRVHAAEKAGHYAVLGVAAPPGGRPKESHDAVKAQYKALCDMFEADKSSSVVAGALKLVNQAFAALTDIRKNAAAVPVSGAARGPATRHRMPPLLPVTRPKAKASAAPARVLVVEAATDGPADVVFLDEPMVPEHKGQGAAADEVEEEENYYAGARGRGGRR